MINTNWFQTMQIRLTSSSLANSICIKIETNNLSVDFYFWTMFVFVSVSVCVWCVSSCPSQSLFLLGLKPRVWALEKVIQASQLAPISPSPSFPSTVFNSFNPLSPASLSVHNQHISRRRLASSRLQGPMSGTEVASLITATASSQTGQRGDSWGEGIEW